MRRALLGPRRRSVGAAAHPGVQRLPEHPRAAARASPSRRCRSAGTGCSGAPLAAQSAAFYRLLPALRAPARAAGRRARARLRLRLGAAHALPGARRPARAPVRLRSRRVDPRRLPRDPRAGDARAAASSSPSGCRSTSRSTSRTRSRSSRTSPRRRTSAACAALHAGLRPGGILVVTVRPPAYLDESAADGRPVRDRARPSPYLFAPHLADPEPPPVRRAAR